MIKETKLVQIGNSKGLRLPKSLISKYGFGERIILEERPDGILIQAANDQKLSWEDTFKAMAREEAEWNEWNEIDVDMDSHL